MERTYQLKAESGFVHTLVNDKTSYEETTGSALIGYAAAVAGKSGVLGKEYYQWAEKIYKNIGGVMKVCAGFIFNR